MPNERLRLALERMGPGDWLTFERFAAEFNAVEFPSLRTTASASGDKGRDGQLFTPGEDVKTAFQYSVTKDWQGKIRATRETLRESMPDVNRLIYCTNQEIGPASDSLVLEFREHNIALDVRDRSWFVERELTATQREVASSELIEKFVMPLLRERGIARGIAPALDSTDARIALLHLTLEGYDQASDRNLTRSCFESLVRSVLHSTNAGNVLSASQVRSSVRNLVPVGDDAQVNAHVDGALSRLSTKGGPVKRNDRAGGYHLSHDEQVLPQEKEIEFLAESETLDQELRMIVQRALPDDIADRIELREAVNDVRTVLESTLMARGEAFAGAVVATSGARQLDTNEILDVAKSAKPRHLSAEQAAMIVQEVLESRGRQLGSICGAWRMDTRSSHSYARRLMFRRSYFRFFNTATFGLTPRLCCPFWRKRCSRITRIDTLRSFFRPPWMQGCGFM